MEWNSVINENLPICSKKAFYDDDDDDSMESERVLVVVNHIIQTIERQYIWEYITWGKIDQMNYWFIGENDDYLKDNEKVTHWMPLPELPKA